MRTGEIVDNKMDAETEKAIAAFGAASGSASGRKYCLGGYELPLRLDFPKISGNQFVRVVDAKGRFVKRFQSANIARKFVDRYNDAPPRSAAVLELGHAKSNDAHCLACKFEMVGGANVGLCPKCGSDRWYRTRLTPND